jgi:alkylation response protein AidB-like acyl-CoA dehydrogenase
MLAGMRTNAVKKGDKYVLNGSKTFITNGVYADYYIVAKTDLDAGNKGISIFS